MENAAAPDINAVRRESRVVIFVLQAEGNAAAVDGYGYASLFDRDSTTQHGNSLFQTAV